MVSNEYLTHGDKEEFDPAKWSSTPGELPPRSPTTHLNVLIVGAGLAGLITALECWRKGHNVVGILERSLGPVYTGDIIVIGPSAICTLRHWPEICRELDQDRSDSVMYYRRHNGELILGPTTLGYNSPEHLAQRHGLPYVAPHQIRRKFYRMLLRQAARVGLKVEYGQRVERYFEDEAAGVGGVVTADGRVRVAHLVVAADAFKTRSDLLIAGGHAPARSSGMSVYRAALPTELALRDPAFQARWGEAVARGASHHEFWIGPGMHLGLFISPAFVAYGLTPRDKFLQPGGNEPIESWDPDVDPQEVLDVLHRIPDWDPAIEGLVRHTPPRATVHWPLRWRNLRREWTSPGGRVVQVGDAAHTTVPASISGGTLAIEDAVTLAGCLQLACAGGAPGGAPLGARIYNLLRYQRVSCVQKMSFVNSENLGAADMNEVLTKDPEKVKVRFPKWLFQHDPEAYVYEKYGQAYSHLVLGTDFQNTNFPPGHKFKMWTIEEIHADILAGKKVADLLDGDWD
ncbi:FAD/NAD(P)-binding domain-containing protein [Aspergillus japonicus CBS 114.51]|uniref:FAD/NAD(P)-binding domain-containing protein n=1 Tax=Aspergillus japonicus CBS 114.51 TaxID=1448312 RepID=A0A8T8X128_ASPJA|nr:FAD/NAD(P)-binding domain-containing protein [Aspergillus japonicus CBS 114.51]RAH81741.1 FAD/NAD(P)-binding domain-containing protein [Aspergillus japonicus CBS 114.51]